MRSTTCQRAFLTMLAICSGYANPLFAQGDSPLSAQDLRTWADELPMTGTRREEIPVSETLSQDGELLPFSGQVVVGIGVDAFVEFESERSLVRIVVVDEQQREHLMYETFPLIAPATAFRLSSVCRETCVHGPMVPSALRIELVDASLEIGTVILNRLIVDESARKGFTSRAAEELDAVKEAQEQQIVELLNRRIKEKGLGWIAGETPISRLTYSEKKQTVCATVMPNFQGFEYYKGGVFAVSPTDTAASAAVNAASAWTGSFDWRNVHGADSPGSPYYDGDPTGGGWLTSIKRQLCGDCWAHAALGATEAQVNLYFNQHLDLDLSEQALVSCSGAGSCAGGDPGQALQYVATTGIVDEACFPESGSDEQCSELCEEPRQRIQIERQEWINPANGEDDIKRRLIEIGPAVLSIISWYHSMVLVGYETNPQTGATDWILKNSWGPEFGENGYARLNIGMGDLYLSFSAYSPVRSHVTPYAVSCRDADGDGYWNWGISSLGRDSCGSVPPEEDCNDSDPAVALAAGDGSCETPVLDVTVPVIRVSTTPPVLWPPDGKMRRVAVTGAVSDSGSGVDASSGTYTVHDEYRLVQRKGRFQIASDGRYSFVISLPASRYGHDKNGRQYEIRVGARDNAANAASVSAVVKVPHDQGRTSKK